MHYMYIIPLHVYEGQTMTSKTRSHITTTSMALCSPKERLPSGVPKEEFGRMIFGTKSSLGDRTKYIQRCRQVLVEVRRGAGTCENP